MGRCSSNALVGKDMNTSTPVRDPEVWRRTKDGVSKIGGASLSVAWELGKAYGKHVIKERLGLDI